MGRPLAIYTYLCGNLPCSGLVLIKKIMLTMLPIAILSAASLLGGAAIVMAFFKRLPAAAVAFLAMLVAWSSGLVAFSPSQLWFWGAAVALALAIRYMVGSAAMSRVRTLYTVGGTLCGSVIGLALGSEAAVIVAGADGAFLGYEAYGHTPAGRRSGEPRRIDAFAAVALPALGNFSIIMLIFAQLLMIK